jgi:hypothetical protein
MDTDTFWKMIEDARKAANGNSEKQIELLVEALSKESAEDIIEFDRILGSSAFLVNQTGHMMNLPLSIL